jgi:glycosyltransferase involved in cell wall biosynthesis
MGRVKVENIDLFPAKVAAPSVIDVLRRLARQRDGRRWPIVDFAISMLGRAVRTLKHHRGRSELYFRTQQGRLSDSWIPLGRRATIAAKTTLMSLLMVLGGIALWLRDSITGVRRRNGAVDPLENPWRPTVWDNAMINRGLYYDPDVVHVHDLPQLFAGVQVARRLKVPLIYDSHEIYTEIATLNEREKKYLRTREQRLIRTCDVVYTVNPFCAKWMTETYKRDVGSITNATTRPTNFDPLVRHREFHKFLGLREDARILCYQGWFSLHGRGLIGLVQAMQFVRKDVHLVMVGYGDHAHFRNVALAAGVRDRIHLIESVPWDELLWWTASADVGVIPYQPVDLNHLYCSPNKLSEFICAHLPMLANDLPYLRQVIDGEGFGIVRPMSTPQNMAAAINEVFDPAFRHIENAKQMLAKNAWRWEWPEESKKLIAIYKNIREPKRPAYASGPARLRNASPLKPEPSSWQQAPAKTA